MHMQTSVSHTSEMGGAVHRDIVRAGVGPQDVGLLETADNSAWHEIGLGANGASVVLKA